MPRVTINSNDIRDQDVDTIDIKPSTVPNQVLKTNASATAVEWGDITGGLGNPVPSYSVIFNRKGDGNKKWLELGEGIKCNKTPYVIPYNSKLNRVSFSNKESDADCDIELYLNGKSSDDIISTLTVVNSRTAIFKDLNLPVLKFDEFRIRIKKNAEKPEDVVVQVFFEVEDNS